MSHPPSTSPASTPPAAALPQATWARLEWMIPLGLIAAGVVCYATIFEYPFVFDSTRYILFDPSIQRLTMDWIHDPRPLLVLSLAINYAIGGTQPAGYHLFNIFVHVVTGLLLFLLVRATLRLGRTDSSSSPSPGFPPSEPRLADAPFGTQEHRRACASWIAGSIALIWMAHPLCTQAVTYTIQRCESMASLFILLCLYASLRASASPWRWGWYGVVFASTGLAVLSKETGYVAPMLVLLFQRSFLDGGFVPAVKRNWPLYALYACVPVALGAMGKIPWFLLKLPEANRETQQVTSLNYALTQPSIILHYLRLSVFPSTLCIDYLWLPEKSMAIIASSSAVIVAILFATAWALFKSPRVGFVMAAFFIVLAPSSSFYPLLDLAVEHRMYLPLVSVIVLIVLGADQALGWAQRQKGVNPWVIAPALVLVVAIALSIRTFYRNQDYSSDVRLWASTAQARPDNQRAVFNLGMAYVNTKEYDKAIPALELAAKMRPDDADPLNGMGLVYLSLHQPREAIASLEAAGRLNAADPVTPYRLGLAYLQTTESDKAVAAFDKAITLCNDPASQTYRIAAHQSAGMLLLSQGKFDLAAARFKSALEVQPRSDRLHFFLGESLLGAKAYDEALTEFQAADELSQGELVGQLGIPRTLIAAGRLDEAAARLEAMVQSNPDAVGALATLGTVREKQGRDADAVNIYSQVLGNPVSQDAGVGPEAARRLAWLRATSHDDSVRVMTPQIVQMMENLNQSMNPPPAMFLDTLAAAYAAGGRFPDAVRVGTLAVESFKAAHVPDLADQASARLALYRSGKAYVSPPTTGPNAPASVKPAPASSGAPNLDSLLRAGETAPGPKQP